MDAAHEIELQRIIENRRKRGSLHTIPSNLLGGGGDGGTSTSEAGVGMERHTSETHSTQTQANAMASRSTNVSMQRVASTATTTTTTTESDHQGNRPVAAADRGSASPPRVPISRKFNSGMSASSSRGSFYLDPSIAAGRGGTSGGSNENFKQPQQQQPPPPQQSILRPPTQARSSVSFLGSSGAASADATAKLREAQALQERKVDQLQDDLRNGLQDIRKVLQEVLQEQRQVPVTAAPPPPPLMHQGSSSASELWPRANFGSGGALQGPQQAKRVLSGFGSGGGGQQQHQYGNHQESFRDRADAQHLVSTPKDARGSGGGIRPGGGNDPGHQQQEAQHHSAMMARPQQRYRSGQETNLRAAGSDPHLDASVIPGRSIPSFEGSSRYETELRRQATSNHQLHMGSSGGNMSSTGRRLNAPTQQFQVGAKPSQPPVNARPFSKTTIDAQSSLTILADGEWWYKWDSSGHKVHLRWVWMDASRRSISWSPKQLHENPMFGPRIPIEDMVRVTTTQISELDPHGNPRTFYVLLIECATRLLQLGTERRDKLNVWYEAIQNVIHSVRQAAQSRVASALSSE